MSHRIPAWQGLAGTSVVTQPNPLPKQGHPAQAAQHRVQAGLEYLQRRRLHSLPGQPVPVLESCIWRFVPSNESCSLTVSGQTVADSKTCCFSMSLSSCL